MSSDYRLRMVGKVKRALMCQCWKEGGYMMCAAELSRRVNPRKSSGLSGLRQMDDVTRNDPGKVGRRVWL